MALQVVAGTLNVVLAAWLIEQKTKTQRSLNLGGPLRVLVTKGQHLAKVFNSFGSVAALTLNLRQTLVRKSKLIVVLALVTNFQEFV